MLLVLLTILTACLTDSCKYYYTEIVPPKYEYVDYAFFEGLAAVRLDGRYGFIDKTGKEVIPLKYESVDNFNEGMAPARLGGKWGFIDAWGNEVIPFIYDQVYRFSEGLAAVCVGGEWIQDIRSDGITYENGKWGYIDKEGNEIVPLIYDKVDYFINGQAQVRIGGMEIGKWGFINTSGEIIVPCKNEHIWIKKEDERYGDGWKNNDVSIVNKNGKKGVMNKNGELIVPYKYVEIHDFYDGIARVNIGGEAQDEINNYVEIKGGKWGYISVNDPPPTQ